jgi:hypothetical protein
MSTQVKTLARCLQAAGYVSKGDSSTCLLFEDRNKLVEKVWIGDEFSTQIIVTPNVRTNTPALYFETPELPPTSEEAGIQAKASALEQIPAKKVREL